MNYPLQILNQEYFDTYALMVGDIGLRIAEISDKLTFLPIDFEHYIIPSAVCSATIEGNSIDVDTFLKNRYFNIKSKPKEMAEINDLIAAYNFAITNSLSQKNFLNSHALLSHTFLALKSQRGKLRKDQVGIFSGGQIEYLAVEPEYLKIEFNKLFSDIQVLQNQSLSMKEVFYFASMIHLVFEKIHPFMDGNGRAGRLLEKWFLASFIGVKAWSITTEKHYMTHRNEYYQNIHIGLNYYALKWERAMPFLLMLPQSI